VAINSSLLVLSPLGEIERELYLVVIRWLSPMDLRMTLAAQCQQVARKFTKDPQIGQVVDFRRAPFPAFFAGMVGAPKDVLAPFAPEAEPRYQLYAV
jgi:hypothetical protein